MFRSYLIPLSEYRVTTKHLEPVTVCDWLRAANLSKTLTPIHKGAWK